MASGLYTTVRTYPVILLCFVAFCLSSCSIEESPERIKEREEIAKSIESQSAISLFADLYEASDGDLESLARMLQVTPSSLERIKKGETVPTKLFEERIKEIAVYYIQNNSSYSKLRSEKDDKWRWYDTVLHPFHHPWWFFIGIALMLALIPIFPIGSIAIAVEYILQYLIAWIFYLICSPSAMEDKFVNTINTLIEQIIH